MSKQIIEDAEFFPLDSVTRYETTNIEPTDAEKKVDAIREALNSDPEAFLSVARQLNGGNSSMEFVGRFPADKYDLAQLQAYLQSHFGGGDYRVKLYAKGKIAANTLLSIAKQVEEMSSNKLNENNALSAVLTRVDNMQQQMMAFMQQQNSGQSRKEMLEEMLMYKQLFSDGGNSRDPLQQLRDIMALQQDLGLGGLPAPEEKEPGFGGLIEKLTPLITAAMQQPVQITPQQHPQPHPQQPHHQQRQQNQQANQMQFMLKTGIKTLLTAAQKGSDPGMYADLILDQLPQEFINQLLAMPDPMAAMSAYEPQITAHKEWFANLIEHVKGQLGMPSIFAHLYSGDDGDSIPENVQGTESQNGDLSINGDS